MEFIDPFDQTLAQAGIPAIFTLNHEGVLQFDLVRTRDFCRQNPGPYTSVWMHSVMVDRATGWPQYVLATSPELILEHERAAIHLFDSYHTAIEEVLRKKQSLYERLDKSK